VDAVGLGDLADVQELGIGRLGDILVEGRQGSRLRLLRLNPLL
jgi:hypothetical protein